MITAVCMNPAFDKTVTVGHLEPGRVNRISHGRVDASGKGVNVAIVAGRLNLEAQCIGCAGEDGAARFRTMLDEQQVKHAFITVPGTLRTNLKVVSLDGSGITELNEPGAAVEGENLAAFLSLATQAAKHSSMAVINGSLPPGCPEGTYRDLIRSMGIPCILDVAGKELLLGLEANPFLIKPNIHELEATLGYAMRGLDDIVRAARQLMDMGAQNVLISMGGDGAVLVTAESAYYAPVVPVKVASTVGAGDSMVGGFLKGLEVSAGDLREALRWGVACATASVMTEGTQLIVPEDVYPLLERVVIQEV